MASVYVLTGYGINADRELTGAFEQAGADAREIHARKVLESPALIHEAGIIAFPGGFSFGDHLGSGVALAGLVRTHLREHLKAFVADGGLILGICNGFQVLVKSGLLPDTDGSGEPTVSLVVNDCGHFIDKWVSLRGGGGSSAAGAGSAAAAVGAGQGEGNGAHAAPGGLQPGAERAAAARSPWLQGIDSLRLPVRHGEGRFVFGSLEAREAVLASGQVAFRYDNGNPNGSVDDIAGVVDSTGRVLGLMPHPEAAVDSELFPDWRRTMPELPLPARTLFANGVAAAVR